MVGERLVDRRRSRRHLPAIAVVLIAFALALAAAPVARPPHARAAGSTVHYKAGWNLVAGPSGSVFGALPGTLYAYGPHSAGYQNVTSADVIGGRGYWAYFGHDIDVTLDATAAQYTRMILPPDRFAIIGNPSSTQTLPINSADVALAYDSTQGYTQVSELKPGQAAFVLSNAGADVSVGKATSQAAADQVRALQAGLTQDAADVSSFGKLPGVAEQFLNARDYAMVQTAMDDTRAAFGDGLLVERAATQPTLTALQADSEVRVRQSVAQAQADVATGNIAGADQAIAAGREAAQDAENDAAAVARIAAGSGQSLALYAGFAQTPTYTAGSLARYGNLCNATVLALGLNLPPSDAFVGLVLAVLNNQPLPPAGGQPAGSTPSSPAASSPTPVPAAGPAPTSVSANCNGQLSLQPNAGSAGGTVTVSFTAKGLDPNSPASVFFGGQLASTTAGTTDAQGALSFSADMSVPMVTGQAPVQVATANRCAQAFFQVLQSGPRVVTSTPMPRGCQPSTAVSCTTSP
ncbi:MAG TPA: hypothetical protein VKV26_04760 [Dehalococcoidia bacterium]|nr:hypothetical protein [Dehalococcoidia bacterium]